MRKLLLASLVLAVSGVVLAVGLGAGGRLQWSDAELALIRSLSLQELPDLPADPSNRVADDPRAAELGKAIFFDRRFSGNGKVACSTCHLPQRQFQDDLPLGRGVGQTDRRTMPIAGVAHAPFLFWDGRKDSLWAQALGPLESAVEHGGNRTQFARLMAEHYRDEYQRIFGPLPDMERLPGNAGPVANPVASATWEQMNAADRSAVNTVFANIGKAIAAFERTIMPAETRFDAWVSSAEFPDSSLLTDQEKAGLRLFIGKAGCINCHNGPLLTDNHFHNTGVPAVSGLPNDRGREAGMRLVREDPFNCLGSFSDAETQDCAELRFMAQPSHESMRAFKAPSLRGAATRPPYMHAGQIRTIEQVLDHYNRAPAAPSGHSELRPLELQSAEIDALKAFLQTLDQAAPVPGLP